MRVLWSYHTKEQRTKRIGERRKKEREKRITYCVWIDYQQPQPPPGSLLLWFSTGIY